MERKTTSCYTSRTVDATGGTARALQALVRLSNESSFEVWDARIRGCQRRVKTIGFGHLLESVLNTRREYSTGSIFPVHLGGRRNANSGKTVTVLSAGSVTTGPH